MQTKNDTPKPEDELDDEHPLWCVNEQIKDLLSGYGANEDHEMVIQFFRETGLPEGTVSRIHKAIVCAESCSAWLVAGITLPPVGQWVLTHGSYGFVVARYEADGIWQAQYVDYETGEPWLRGDGGEPQYWMPLPSMPNSPA